jgi:hypothetical protein
MKITEPLEQLFNWTLNHDHMIFRFNQIKWDFILQRDFIKTLVSFYLTPEIVIKIAADTS